MAIALGIVCALISLGITVIFLVEMFQDAVLKGIFGLLCGLYLLYYVLFESEHEHKWLLLLGQLAFAALARYFLGSFDNPVVEDVALLLQFDAARGETA